MVADKKKKQRWINWCFLGFNVVFWLTGCALIGVGIWVVGGSAELSSAYSATFPGDTQTALGTNTWERIRMLGVSAMVIGSVVLVLGFIGFGETGLILLSLLIVLAILFAMLVASGIFVSVFGETMREWLEKSLNFEADLNVDLPKGLLFYANSRFDCCGVDSEPICTKNYPPYSHCSFGSTNCTIGCWGPLWDQLYRMKFGLGTTLIASSIPMIFGMTFSMIRLLRKNS